MFMSCSVVAGEDMSAAPQFIAVNLSDGKPAASGALAGGILQNRPKNGEHASVFYLGESEFRAGGTITKGIRLTVSASGYVTAYTDPVSGSSGYSVGRSLSAVASGGVGRGLFNFANGITIFKN